MFTSTANGPLNLASAAKSLADMHRRRKPLSKHRLQVNASRSTRRDLTYRRLRQDTREESNAVVLCVMDTSGSMDRLKKYLARSFFFLLYQFVCTKYQNVQLVFIGHHTKAKEVSEDEFFHKGESGGTMISSGYKKALEIIHDRFPSSPLEYLRVSLFRWR